MTMMTMHNIFAFNRARLIRISTFLLIVILLLVSACRSSRDSTTPEELQDFQNLREMVDGREFEIENRWAMPMGGNMVNLIGNPNTIKFTGDSLQVHLPYFGERYSGGGYGSEGGIRFNGIPEDFSVEEDESGRKIVVEFEGQHRNESLNFYVTIFPNGAANTSVNSSHRSGISYRGEIKPVQDPSEEN